MTTVLTKRSVDEINAKIHQAISTILTKYGLTAFHTETHFNDILLDIKINMCVNCTPANTTGLMENLLRNINNFNITVDDLFSADYKIQLGGTYFTVLGMLSTTDRRCILVFDGSQKIQITPELLRAALLRHKIGKMLPHEIEIEVPEITENVVSGTIENDELRLGREFLSGETPLGVHNTRSFVELVLR